MNYFWKFSREEYKAYLEKLNTMDCDSDYLGSVYIGDICIDFVCHAEFIEQLYLDFYVLHENTGYGYTKNNIPYDYAEGIIIDTPYNLSYDQFKEKVERLCKDYIFDYKGHYSLLDHINRKTEVW